MLQLERLDKLYGKFYCPVCEQAVVKRLYIGKKDNACSMKCTRKRERLEAFNEVMLELEIPFPMQEKYKGCLDYPNVIRDTYKSLNYRCYSGHDKYKTYKDKGIKVCDEWGRGDYKGYIRFAVWALDYGLLLSNDGIEKRTD